MRNSCGRAAKSALFLTVLCVSMLGPRVVSAQGLLQFDEEPLRNVLSQIEQQSEYRFLYRDVLVAGVSVSLASNDVQIMHDLGAYLKDHRLGLQVDDRSGQVVLYRLRAAAQERAVIDGSVVDGETGAALPFATVSWTVEGRLRGVVADEGGRFAIAEDALGSGQPIVRGSYVGYRSLEVPVDTDRLPPELTLRLAPLPIESAEVVVTGVMLETDLDTTFRALLTPGQVAPLGESSLLRAMQALPAVSVAPALTGGIIVRGSGSDGFQVLLDGMPIYSQSHLFGLFDTFNSDALQTVGLFYGVAPATYEAPPGGTVSYLTRAGSRQAVQGSLGASNTSLRGTLEGPIAGGKGSWLLSGRQSYLGSVNWFGNYNLVSQGLNADRQTSDPGGLNLLDVQDAVSRTALNARYFDLHGKAVWEWAGGARLVASGYVGGDTTLFRGTRLTLTPENAEDPPGNQNGQGQGNRPPFQQMPTETSNRWGSEAAAMTLQAPLGPRGLLESSVGFSTFTSAFAKDDFVFVRPRQVGNRIDPESATKVLGAFGNDNRLTHLKTSQELSLQWAGGTFSTGTELSSYEMRYEEASLDRAGFELRRTASQVDAFAGWRTGPAARVSLDLGLRMHHYTLGARTAWSPRVRASRSVAGWALSAGYSRNHQFLHRLNLEHEANADIWILTGADEEAGRSDYATLGVRRTLGPGASLQIESYWKSLANARLHESVAQGRLLADGASLLRPWLTDVEGEAGGVEFMVTHMIGRTRFSHGYTRSFAQFRHPAVNRGQTFDAPWDRPHQYVLQVHSRLSPRISAGATWSIASGTPNDLAFLGGDERMRNGTYHRLDLSLSYTRMVGSNRLSARLAVYNAYDRDNVWYRTPVPIAIRDEEPRLLVTSSNVDVYDLGFQPSFELRIGF